LSSGTPSIDVNRTQVWLPTAGEMAALDRDATASGHTTERTLIETAGREVARQVALRFPEGPVAALLGSGHNGADALVALRSLRAWGRDVTAVRCGSSLPEPEVRAGWELEVREPSALEATCRSAAVVLDGLLGTGVTGAPREPAATFIARLNAIPRPVVAVDGPSGADFTTGRTPGACVRATLTVCLGWPKLGLLLHPARGHCGELVCVEIGFPPPAGDRFGARAITARWAAELLIERGPEAHKGEAGYLALVAGQVGMAGASVLAARSAVRAGAGIVRVIGDPANRVVVQSAVPEALFVGWDDDRGVRESLEWADAVAVGPGLGGGPERRGLVERTLADRGGRPVVVDADGLNAFAGRMEALADLLDGKAVITPHPGELARLRGGELSAILEDRPGAARATARDLGVPVLLKGVPALVALPTGRLRVATAGGPAVASGGSGDVLTGIVGAYLAAGLGPADAATAALMIGGLAADRSPCPEGHLPTDVPDRLPAVRAEMTSTPPPPPGPVLFSLLASRSAGG
jgi:NAD(P)H-hydrate epimerase